MSKPTTRKAAIKQVDAMIRAHEVILSKMQDHLDFGNRNGKTIVTQAQVDQEAASLRDAKILRRRLVLLKQ